MISTVLYSMIQSKYHSFVAPLSFEYYRVE